MTSKVRKIIRFIAIVLLIAIAVWGVNNFGLERIRANIDQLGIWAPLGVFALRFTSVVIPALPGTAYSALAGGLFGFTKGVIIISLADLASCSLSFFLSRQYGRRLVQKLVGERFMNRVDSLSQQHLDRNFFLMTAFLMTGFFDFVCYGVGLTKTLWIRFLPALILSILISNPPVVALGAGVLEGGKLLLGFALLGAFGLAAVTGFVQKRRRELKPETVVSSIKNTTDS
ncbi:MAG: VTT domain-containing protein [Leptolyngbyaceae cyanobacterium MO_188.B28]|nr:VTT domain-containing protein [Leptolyngbyaceae cyanobacterium MO_188.B28]